MRTTACFVLAIAIGAWSVPAEADGDAKVGKSVYGVCASCHGFRGEGNPGIQAPKLNGLSDWYLTLQIENFRKGVRGADPADRLAYQMHQMSAALRTDADVANVVAYVAGLPDTEPPALVDGDAERGRALYAPCAACHGANGEGNAMLNGPRLAGMSDWYHVAQLESFRDGRRGSHPDDVYGRQMAPMAATLPDDQAVRDVVAYINTLD